MKIEFYDITTYSPVIDQHNYVVDYYGVVYADEGGNLRRCNHIAWRVVE